MPDSLKKPRGPTREDGYTTGSFLACRYCIALCRRFRQMAKELQPTRFPGAIAQPPAGGLSHRHLKALALGSTGNIPTGT
ncbi:MAG: hypothetical protein MUC60_17255 [Oscillatoria sp. Prado101]|nr:hypothetical protein [Oscillatoria sp. Prado101]